MLRYRKPLLAFLMAVLLTGALLPGATATTYLSAGAATGEGAPPGGGPVRVVSSTGAGVTFEVRVPWEQLSLEPVTVDGRAYVRASLPGWSVTSEAGAPALPFLAEAIGAPVGVKVAVRSVPGRAHTLALPAPVLPAATQVVEWGLPAAGDAELGLGGPSNQAELGLPAPSGRGLGGGPGNQAELGLPAPFGRPQREALGLRSAPGLGGPGGLPVPVFVVQEDAAVYGGQAAYPPVLAEVTSDGAVRQQRVVGITVYPVQYHPGAQELTVYESLAVEVTFAGSPPEKALGHAPAADSAAYEEMFRGELLNYETARAWRQALPASAPEAGEAEEGTSASAAGAGMGGLPWAPPVPGWRVKVRTDGLYRLGYAELASAGLPVKGNALDLDPHTFRLYNLGSEVAIHVEGEADGTFGNDDYILFYGQGVAAKYTRDNVYWLTYGQENGLRMGLRDGTPIVPDTPAHYPARRHMEQNQFYLPLTPGDETLDRWMWDYAYPPSRPSWSHTFALAAPYAGTYPATLTVAMLGYLQNAINPDHHVRVYLNGTQVADVTWDGIAWQIVEVPIAQGLLVAGNNTLQVVCPNDTGVGADVVYVDRAELEFANTFWAEGDVLSFTYDASGTWKFQVDGFSTDQVAVYDVSNPAAIVQITGLAVEKPGQTYTLRFQDAVAAPGNYVATATTAYRTVQAIEADTASALGSTANGADQIIITHKDFSVQAAQLRDHRASQGQRAVLVDVQDVYDEFGYGLAGTAPIHDFLAYAYAQWQTPAPSYVVLIGDGHYDPKNYVYTRASYLPPYLAPVDPWIGETAADNRYVTLVGADTMPDMMLGRLAVNSSAEATAFVNKIVAYEGSPAGGWQQQVLAVADNADSAGNFAQLSDGLLGCCLPAPYGAEKVYYGVTHLTKDQARAAIQAGINAGKLIVNYIGHGATTQWADEGLFKVTDVAGLANVGKLPVVLAMTCREGYYHFPDPIANGREALAEVVTRAEGKGAVASWSPTGLGVASGHDSLDRGFFEALFRDGVDTVGQATAAGKLKLWATGVNLDLLDTYLLFGDPATIIAVPDAPPPTETPTPTATSTPTATPTPTPTATPTGAPASSLHVGAIAMGYTLKTGKYTVTAVMSVLDAANRPVSSATVDGRWTLPDGTTAAQQAVSTRKGTASFKITNKLTGSYRLCVTNVAKAGYVYDPTKNVETCDSVTVP